MLLKAAACLVFHVSTSAMFAQQEPRIIKSQAAPPIAVQRDFAVSVDERTKTVKVNEMAKFTITVHNKDTAKAFKNVRVQAEAFDKNDTPIGKPDIVTPDEGELFGPDERKPYTVAFSFPEPGTYTIKVGLFQPPPDNVSSFYWMNSAARVIVSPR